MMPRPPVLPNFMDNLPQAPKWPPTFVTTTPTPTKSESLMDAYFKGDLRVLQQDAASRREHYSPEQHEILEALVAKKPLPVGTTTADLNDIVFRFTERTTQKKKRREAVGSAQRKLDPTVARLMESPGPSFEAQSFPQSIKII